MRKWILASCLALVASVAQADGVENKWRVEFSGNAESDGRIVLELAPARGEPMRASACTVARQPKLCAITHASPCASSVRTT